MIAPARAKRRPTSEVNESTSPNRRFMLNGRTSRDVSIPSMAAAIRSSISIWAS